jgi:hypothetical protein
MSDRDGYEAAQKLAAQTYQEGYQAGLAQAEKLVAKERADVVAWLRNEPSLSMEGDFPLNANWALGKAANTIERLEHINASGAGVEGDGK